MTATKAQQALTFAKKVAETGAGWQELHNAVFGIGGKCMSLFPSTSERTAFSKTPEYTEITVLILTLAEEADQADDVAEPPIKASGNLSVRLPISIHAALMREAKAEDVSINQLILAKLSVQLGAVVR
jgi:hypothetical protein